MTKQQRKTKVVWDGMTYDELLEVWNKHLHAYIDDKQNQQKLNTKKHWDRVLDFVEKQNNIQITLNDCIK
tara:strand:- start:459 stop:668 length:210 start_codon:yes stop_codon:yes gene_type:complete